MIDLSRPEGSDADNARCYVIHEQSILLDMDMQIPALPAFLLRQHPDYHFIGWLNGEPCYVCEMARHELDDGNLQPVPQRRMLAGDLNEAGFTMFSRALQFLSWQNNHRFCSRCGTPAEAHGRENWRALLRAFGSAG